MCKIWLCIGVTSILTNTNTTFQASQKMWRGTKIRIRKTVLQINLCPHRTEKFPKVLFTWKSKIKINGKDDRLNQKIKNDAIWFKIISKKCKILKILYIFTVIWKNGYSYFKQLLTLNLMHIKFPVFFWKIYF
jgi:hypothetical protein